MMHGWAILTFRQSPLRTGRLIQQRTFLDPRRIAAAKAPGPVDKLAEFTRDDQITDRFVRLKDDNGAVGQPQDLRRILRNIDRKTHTLVQLSKSSSADTPIVQIYSLIDLLKRVREREERARQQERALKDRRPKQIELNWAISENDLSLKLKQMQTFLEKGKKVEILLAAKKKQRRATREEGDAVLRQVRDKIEEAGAREVSPMEGEILKQATLVAKKT